MPTGVFDILIRGGRLIDPSQDIDDIRDVAIAGGKVVAVGEDLPADQASQVIGAEGKIVTPGWVDIHVHVYWGVSHYGIEPDTTCLNRGVTTAVDLGSAGAQTWPAFRHFILEKSKTRLFAFLNISSAGMITATVGENEDLRFLDVDYAVRTVRENRDFIKGMKVRLTKNLVGVSGSEEPLKRARQAADALHIPLAVHPNNPTTSLSEILSQLKEGDVLTHCFHGKAEGILDANGKVKPEVWDAAQRGVRFDVGHGQGSFSFQVVERALQQGFQPYSISSDLHSHSLHTTAFDQATTLSKFLYLGMALPEIIRKTTTNPAMALEEGHRLGTLVPGAEADVTICEIQEGPVQFVDCERETRQGNQRLVPLTVVRGGKVLECGAVGACF